MEGNHNTERLKSFWRRFRWLLLGMLGVVSSAGCANYAATAHEPFYYAAGALNLAAYVIVCVKGMKKEDGK